MEDQAPQPIAYATPLPRDSARGWAGFAIVLAGLALVGLGGCFLIGVMILSNPNLITGKSVNGLSPAQLVLMIVLYACAFASFAAAVYLLARGITGLLRILNIK